MAKKVVKKKKTSKKKVVKKKTAKKPTIRRHKIPKDDAKLERVLIENFVGLQKVMVNLSVKFDDLSSKISKLLDLFEISAKALAEKDLTVEKTAKDDKKILQEIGSLSEQNKVIARGLTLMHDRLSGEPGEIHEPMPSFNPEPMPAPRPPMRPRPQKTPMQRRPSQGKNVVSAEGPNTEGYQKSIYSTQPTFKKLPKQEDAKTNI